MAAYAALVSVVHIIEQIQRHPRPPISLEENQVQSLTKKVTFLREFLELYSHVSNEETDRLQSQIAGVAYAAEDVIESHIVDRILDQSTTHGEQINSVDLYQSLEKVIKDMVLIQKEVIEIKKKLESVSDIQQHMTRSTPAAASLRYSSTEKNIMVGFDSVLEEIMDKLTRRQTNRQIFPIVGMGGIGKTTLAKNLYEKPLIVQDFDIRAWATISQEYNVKEVLLELLCSQGSRGNFGKASEENLGEMLHKTLCGRRYLIILDDMWTIEAWNKLQRYLPKEKCEGRIIITSRSWDPTSDIPSANVVRMSFLDKDESWILLCRIVFGEGGCPPELEEIGQKIAERCKGLPLSIMVIGGLLAKSEQTREYWEYIANNLSSVVNLEDNERCLKVLYMSYNYLPIYLKPCFLYMGVIYSEDDTIIVSELIKLWVAEGFLKPISEKSLEEVAEEYLNAIVERNLILVDEWKYNGKVKLCRMHDLLRDLCLREAKKDKFLCVTTPENLKKISQDINTHRLRRVAFHGRSSWEEDKYHLSECDDFQSAPSPRSLIEVSLKILPSCNCRLSRVLKFYKSSGATNFVEFGFRLVNLRYFAITTSSSKYVFLGSPSAYLFWNLQTIIVDMGQMSNVDIWKMPLLQHVKLMMSSLTDPGRDDFVLKKLQTLSTIRNFKCGEEVVKRIPNIRKLKFFYDKFALLRKSPSDYSLNNLGRLHKLESLSCSFLWSLGWSDLEKQLMFPPSLKKLVLEGCRLHWKDISMKLDSLTHLQILELGWNSFMGPEWETVEDQFPSLKVLKLRGLELEYWTTEASHFPQLEHLFLNDLCSLKEVPSDIGNITTLKLIKLYCCSTAALDSAKEIAKEQNEYENQELQIQVCTNFGKAYEEFK